MKKLSFLFLFLLLAVFHTPSTTAQAQEATTFILVRHAEKADDGTDDPPLNEIGQQRAKSLAGHLKETNITAIYSTNFKRTVQTVQQIADAKALTIKTYDPSDPTTLKNMLVDEAGGIVLFSGHSNTTPVLVNQLIGEERYQQFDDSDYDNLFIVMTKEMGKGTVLLLTF
jgi:phosphohistidine phosphatase SixA